MKTIRLLFAISLFGALCHPVPSRAQSPITMQYFQDNLASYGQWIQTDMYGSVWQPNGVSSDWRPYTEGYWAYTDSGWAWMSNEPWGDITYHYGRWVDLDDAGWGWVPDTEWAPAWVTWRSSDDFIGWAPIPPLWHKHGHNELAPARYTFCNFHDFGGQSIVVIPATQNVIIFNKTKSITYRGKGGFVLEGPSYDIVSAKAGRTAPKTHISRDATGKATFDEQREVDKAAAKHTPKTKPEIPAETPFVEKAQKPENRVEEGTPGEKVKKPELKDENGNEFREKKPELKPTPEKTDQTRKEKEHAGDKKAEKEKTPPGEPNGL